MALDGRPQSVRELTFQGTADSQRSDAVRLNPFARDRDHVTRTCPVHPPANLAITYAALGSRSEIQMPHWGAVRRKCRRGERIRASTQWALERFRQDWRAKKVKRARGYA